MWHSQVICLHSRNHSTEMNSILWEFSFWSTFVTFSPLLVPRTTQWGREGFPFCRWRMEVQTECNLPELYSCQWLNPLSHKKLIPYHSCLFISRRRLCGIHGLPGQRPNLNRERGRGGRRKVDDLIHSKQKPATLPRGRSLRQRWLIQHRYLQVSVFGEGLSRGKDY